MVKPKLGCLQPELVAPIESAKLVLHRSSGSQRHWRTRALYQIVSLDGSTIALKDSRCGRDKWFAK
jgi:hypothetical protein